MKPNQLCPSSLWTFISILDKGGGGFFWGVGEGVAQGCDRIYCKPQGVKNKYCRQKEIMETFFVFCFFKFLKVRSFWSWAIIEVLIFIWESRDKIFKRVNIFFKYNLYNTKPSWLNIQHTCLWTINLLQLNLQCTLQEESHTIDLLFIQIDKYEIGTSKNRWLLNGPKWADVNFLNVFYFF